jgi:hypothetical protein
MQDQQFTVEYEMYWVGEIKIRAMDEIEAMAKVEEMGRFEKSRNELYSKLKKSDRPVRATDVRSPGGYVLATKTSPRGGYLSEDGYDDHGTTTRRKKGKKHKKGKRGKGRGPIEWPKIVYPRETTAQAIAPKIDHELAAKKELETKTLLRNGQAAHVIQTKPTVAEVAL